MNGTEDIALVYEIIERSMEYEAQRIHYTGNPREKRNLEWIAEKLRLDTIELLAALLHRQPTEEEVYEACGMDGEEP
jgi:hypothetical protein